MMEKPIGGYKPVEKLELRDLKNELPKVFKKVCCPSCNEDVVADNLNLANSMAKCGSCNVIFSIEEEVESVKEKGEMKQETFRPEGIDLFYYKDELDITTRQHIEGLDAFGLVFMPIFAILSIFIFFAGEGDFSLYIPIALSLGSLYFIYKALNYSKNQTIININNNFLNIYSRPKNFKKDRTYNANEIDQLYLKHGTEGLGYYAVHMVLNGLEGQKHVKLVTVNTLSKAKYLEQEIERYLNIENRKILESNVQK